MRAGASNATACLCEESKGRHRAMCASKGRQTHTKFTARESRTKLGAGSVETPESAGSAPINSCRSTRRPGCATHASWAKRPVPRIRKSGMSIPNSRQPRSRSRQSRLRPEVVAPKKKSNSYIVKRLDQDYRKNPRDVAAERKCLQCDVMFKSEGIGNRLCHRCSRRG